MATDCMIIAGLARTLVQLALLLLLLIYTTNISHLLNEGSFIPNPTLVVTKCICFLCLLLREAPYSAFERG